jgi:hypothetical protein
MIEIDQSMVSQSMINRKEVLEAHRVGEQLSADSMFIPDLQAAVLECVHDGDKCLATGRRVGQGWLQNRCCDHYDQSEIFSAHIDHELDGARDEEGQRGDEAAGDHFAKWSQHHKAFNHGVDEGLEEEDQHNDQHLIIYNFKKNKILKYIY